MNLKRVRKITVDAVNEYTIVDGRLQDAVLNCMQVCRIPIVAMNSDDKSCEIKVRSDVEQLNKLLEHMMQFKALFYIRKIS